MREAKATIPGFTPLASSIHVRSPTKHVSGASSIISSDSTTATCGPDLIILTSWTGANTKHIAKYTHAYTELYPTCPILLVTTKLEDLTIRSTEQKTKALKPAVLYIESQIKTRPVEEFNILLHAFSEGGSNKAVCLAKAFLAHAHYQLPVSAFVFDSTPGLPRFSNNLAAFKRSLPHNPVARFLGLFVGAAFLGVVYGAHHVLVPAENNIISKTRRAINDPSLWRVAGVPRAYVFSEADDLISWRDVEEHSEVSAKDHGVTTVVVRYKNSGHCDHMRDNEEHYWGAVKQTWESRVVEISDDASL